MKFIEIPVLFNKDNAGERIMEESITEFIDSDDYDLDYLSVNPNAIAAYNRSTDDRCTTIRLIGGETWNAFVKFEDLKRTLEAI